MLKFISKKIWGTRSEKILRTLKSSLQLINSLEENLTKLSDEDLRNKTPILKSRYQNGENLDALLPEAFAIIRETAKRILNERHYDVQILGGLVLHKGMIAEMKTGEGKTLVSSLPVYLNALTGEGVHVITVNDYLAERDSKWMGAIYEFHGLSVGCLTASTALDKRQEIYQKDIVYGTNNEFGFDYLRDNLKHDENEFVQKKFKFAIIDEVDSILIDEARTPLIISGVSSESTELYAKIQHVVKSITTEDYELDEKSKSALFTEQGISNIERLLQQNQLINSDSSLYDIENTKIVHHINQSIKANKLFHIDKDYIVKNDMVYIIDEFTGRIMDGRRYSDGLHQSIEAKENVAIQKENQTLASITYQNYFRLYDKLGGMTGTAITEAQEFLDIYGLETVQIPTNIPIKRKDHDDVIYKTSEAKHDAIVAEVQKIHATQQPILIGTVSIEKSEQISKLLKKAKIKHNVLNAKYHAQEADIIAQAGKLNSVTIATNMAGRGTDIKLGGNEKIALENLQTAGKYNDKNKEKILSEITAERAEIINIGGLYIIGTERHESRRIDNQLRGRAGRQGDPGQSKFFLSLEDDLMRIFASEKIGNFLGKLGLKDDEAIEHPWINKSIIKAQQKVETRNYEIRKNLLKFDNVMNDQRKVIYKQRLEVMQGQNFFELLQAKIEDFNANLCQKFIPEKSFQEEWQLAELQQEVHRIYNIDFDCQKEKVAAHISKKLNEKTLAIINKKKDEFGLSVFSEAIKKVFLINLDLVWKEHLHTLDHLKGGINLRAYGQKEPLNEYKLEAFNLFETMFEELEEKIITQTCRIQISHALPNIDDIMPNFSEKDVHDEMNLTQQKNDKSQANNWPKTSRNALCPCESGKKYKHCHGKFA
jgi:preprotein translocase subunit SecA